MKDKYYNDTKYYKRLKELKDNILVCTINGRRVSKEEFNKYMNRLLQEGEKHADKI